MAAEFSLEAVRECMLEKGGRIRNHELVTYFKQFLNDPQYKSTNREKFKDFVNELATIKVEDGEKILVLKRKHRPESTMSSSSSSISSSRSSEFTPSTTSTTPSAKGEAVQFKQPAAPRERESGYVTPPSDALRAHSEPPERCGFVQRGSADHVDGALMSKGHSDDSLDVRGKTAARTGAGSGGQEAGPGGHRHAFDASTPSTGSSSTVSGDDDGNASVLSIRERVQQMNKISSESDLQQSRLPPRKSKAMKERDDDDESHTSGGSSYITLTAEEKEWMLVSATADYHEMFKLLNKNTRLVKVKDIANGYTALHWAAKFGKPEVVKLLANKIGVNVNQRSHGGYTPLHLAAIQGHEDIIELLVTVYKADPNVRDYSGKKAKQYLKNSASSRAQRAGEVKIAAA